MKRSRRIVVTGAVVAGALGGAGLTLTGSPAGAGVATVTMSAPAAPAADTHAAALTQLDALASQLARAERGLRGELVAATRDEQRAKRLHDAALREAAGRAAKARAAQQAAAQQAAAQAGGTTPVAGQGLAPMPQVHATTRASGAVSSGGDDGGGDSTGGGDDRGDSGGGGDD